MASSHANRVDDSDQASHVIVVSICPGNGHRLPIAVACHNGPMERFCRRNCKHAGAASDVEDTARPARPDNLIKREQAAARRTVVAGSECKCRLDFDSNPVLCDPSSIMGSVNNETSS
jgi:hypothetical protein